MQMFAVGDHVKVHLSDAPPGKRDVHGVVLKPLSGTTQVMVNLVGPDGKLRPMIVDREAVMKESVDRIVEGLLNEDEFRVSYLDQTFPTVWAARKAAKEAWAKSHGKPIHITNSKGRMFATVTYDPNGAENVRTY